LLKLVEKEAATMRVLIVEDDQTLCGVFEEFLSEIGHQPLVVHGAEAALDALRAERPDAILLDICLPGMSGLDFLSLPLVREQRVPTLVISGRVNESQAQECLRLGAFDFMGKPVALQRLAEVLACLDSRPSARRPGAQPNERRRAPRASLALPVRGRERSGGEWESTSANLSTSGIKVHASGSIRPGQETTLTLTLPDGDTRLEVESVLVRADLDGFAFRFLNLTDWQVQRLQALLRRSAGARPTRVEPHLRILHRIGRAVGVSPDVDEVLRVALDALTQVTGHEISSLHLLSADGATLRLRGDRGLRPRLREVTRVLPAGQGIIGRVAASGNTVHLSDATESLDLWPGARAIVSEEGIHVFVCVPIQNRGETLGVLSLGRRTPEPFTQSEIALVEASANQIGLALANAQLYAETRRRLEDLKVAEVQLIEGEKLSAVGRMAAGLAHEVRNRLTAILGHAELLLMGADDAAHTRQRLNTIVDETSSAARMLQNLLRFSGMQATERQLCHLRDQIQWVLEVKGGALRRDGIRVVTALDSVPPVRADETQLQQVLLNLVQNAHQALAAHAGERELTVRLSQTEGKRVRLEVLDTGPGIPPELLPRIFDAFSTTKPRSEGTGLGLWVSCAIIEEHKGTLRAENRAGGGAAFVIELPAATALWLDSTSHAAAQ
jgi:signal transduction histidine kinase/DNA-binding response OmpR family regulator